MVTYRKYNEVHQNTTKERKVKIEVWGALTLSFCSSSLALSFFCMMRATAKERKGKICD